VVPIWVRIKGIIGMDLISFLSEAATNKSFIEGPSLRNLVTLSKSYKAPTTSQHLIDVSVNVLVWLHNAIRKFRGRVSHSIIGIST